MTYDFDEDHRPIDCLDELVATTAKVTEAFKPGGMPQAMLDLAWEILLDEFRELRRAQQAHYKAMAPPPKGDGARAAKPSDQATPAQH
jgi:hypothetical protein